MIVPIQGLINIVPVKDLRDQYIRSIIIFYRHYYSLYIHYFTYPINYHHIIIQISYILHLFRNYKGITGTITIYISYSTSYIIPSSRSPYLSVPLRSLRADYETYT